MSLQNGNGNGPGWRMIALALMGMVIPIVGWVVTSNAQDVKDLRGENRQLNDRLGRLEVRYVEDVATIKTQVKALSDLLIDRQGNR